MIPVFTNSVLPTLRSLARTDQSYWVKKRARAAIEEIDRHIKEAGGVQITGP